MKILLKGVHATRNAGLLRDKLAIAADIVCCLGDESEGHQGASVHRPPLPEAASNKP